jgi:hypothetical protein
MQIINIKSGVDTIKSTHHIVAGPSIMHLLVENRNDYTLINGNIKLTEDFIFNLATSGAANGCDYTLHLDCSTIDLNGHAMFITYNYGNPGYSTIKEIKQADINAMLNKEGGIIIKFRYYDGKWRVMEQNYSYGMPGTVSIFSGELAKYFDSATGNGIAPGYYGYQVFAKPGDKWPVNVPLLSSEPGNDVALIKQMV